MDESRLPKSNTLLYPRAY